eukprot:5265839-Pleurochrysis_carterae.AAC.1
MSFYMSASDDNVVMAAVHELAESSSNDEVFVRKRLRKAPVPQSGSWLGVLVLMVCPCSGGVMTTRAAGGGYSAGPNDQTAWQLQGQALQTLPSCAVQRFPYATSSHAEGALIL